MFYEMSIRLLNRDPLLPDLDVNVYFWPKQRYTFSQISIAIAILHQNSILHIDRPSSNCNISYPFNSYSLHDIITYHNGFFNQSKMVPIVTDWKFS